MNSEKPALVFYEKYVQKATTDPDLSFSHGPDGLRRLRGELERKYNVITWKKNIIDLKEPANVIILLAERNKLYISQLDIKSLTKYVSTGGSLFVIYDSRREEIMEINIDKLTSKFGFVFNNDLLWDDNNVVEKNWYEVKSNDFSIKSRILIKILNKQKNSILKNIKEIWYWGCSISKTQSKYVCEEYSVINSNSNAYSAELSKSSTFSFIPTRLIDGVYTPEKGNIPLILIANTIKQKNMKNKRGGKIIGYGGLFTFTNDSLYHYDHLDLFINCINWLVEGSTKINIENPSIMYKIIIFLRSNSDHIVSFITGFITSLMIEYILNIL